jgi:hypothetical protein
MIAISFYLNLRYCRHDYFHRYYRCFYSEQRMSLYFHYLKAVYSSAAV